MSNLDQRDKLIAQMDCLNDQIEERWPQLTNRQVEQLKGGIESLWAIVCRRGKRA